MRSAFFSFIFVVVAHLPEHNEHTEIDFGV